MNAYPKGKAPAFQSQDTRSIAKETLVSMFRVLWEKFGKRLVAVLAVLSLAVVVTACAGSDGDSPSAQQQCFQPISAAQAAQIQAQYGTNNTVTTASGDVCVLTSANGVETEQYYNSPSQNNWFWMYMLMSNHASGLATYGVLTGQISPFDAILLSQLRSVGSDGTVYRPYSRTSSGWSQNNTVVNHTVVKYVRYGTSSKPVSYSSVATGSSKPPKGYVVRTMPSSSGKLGTVSKTGRISSSTMTGSTAQKYGYSGYKSSSSNSGSRSGSSGYKSGSSGYKSGSSGYKSGSSGSRSGSSGGYRSSSSGFHSSSHH